MDTKSEAPKLGKKKLLEVIAAYIHYIWAEWVKDLIGGFSPAALERAKRLAATRYKDLTEEDKEKRRAWAREILRFIGYKD